MKHIFKFLQIVIKHIVMTNTKPDTFLMWNYYPMMHRKIRCFFDNNLSFRKKTTEKLYNYLSYLFSMTE